MEKAEAKKCRYCGEWLGEGQASPQEPKEEPQVATKPQVEEEKPQMEEKPVEQSWQEEPIEEEEPQGFVETYFTDVYIRNFFNFTDALGRKHYWMSYLLYALFIWAFCSVLGAVATVLPTSVAILTMVLMYIVLLAFTISGIAAAVRRLHDTGKSGWWYLICCVPIVGPIWLLVLLCKKGDAETPDVEMKTPDIVTLVVTALLIIASSIFAVKNLASITNGTNTEDGIEAVDEEADVADSDSTMVYQLEVVEDADYMQDDPQLVQIGSFDGYDYFVSSEFIGGGGENGCPAGLSLYRLKSNDHSGAAGIIDLYKINEQSGADETGYAFYADMIMDYVLRDGDLFLVLQDSRDMEEKEANMALVKLNLETFEAAVLLEGGFVGFGDDRETVTYDDSSSENAQTKEVNLSDL